MSLIHLSLDQVLDIWTDLEQALQKKHGFGGSVAEIYVFRSVPHSRLAQEYLRGSVHKGQRGEDSITKEAFEDVYGKAWDGLRELFLEFQARHSQSILHFSLNPGSKEDGTDPQKEWIPIEAIEGIPTVYRYYIRVLQGTTITSP